MRGTCEVPNNAESAPKGMFALLSRVRKRLGTAAVA
jgi:hypothetical protein